MGLEQNTALRIATAIKQNFLSFFKREYKIINLSWLDIKIYKHLKQGKIYSHRVNSEISIKFSDPLGFLHAAEEIYKREIYLFDPINKRPKIIDCGGYIGLSAIYFSLKYPNAHISVYEPDRVNYSIAKQNLDNPKFSNVRLENAAVWINNGFISFNETNNMGSSIEKNNSNNEHSTQVKSIRLKDIINEPIDFLKIDIEGAEYEVLKDIKEELKNVDKLFIEYHGLYNEQYKLNEILEILNKANFNYYIKEADEVYKHPFTHCSISKVYDVQLNIFAKK